MNESHDHAPSVLRHSSIGEPATIALIHLWAGEIEKAAGGVNGRMGVIQGRSLFNTEAAIAEVEHLRDLAGRMRAFAGPVPGKQA